MNRLITRWIVSDTELTRLLTMPQEHPAELRRGTPALRVHAGHVGPARPRARRGADGGRRLLVLRGSHGQDHLRLFAQGCRHGQAARELACLANVLFFY